MRKLIGGLLALSSLWCMDPAFPQVETLLPEKTINDIINEVSGEIAFEHIRQITEFNRPDASKGYRAAAEYVKKKAIEYELQDVRIIELPAPMAQWDVTFGELWLMEPEERKLIDFKEIATAVAVNSHSVDVKAELIDVGSGTQASDYEGKDVKGKIVLASGSPGEVLPLAVFERGALGVVSSVFRQAGPQFDYPDQVGWSRIPLRSDDGRPGTFAFMISLRMADELKARFKKGEKLVVHAKIESEIMDPGKYEIVEAVIPGSRIHNQDILFTAHLDHQKPGANDNASGSANILEIARTINTLIKRGKIPRPKRDIRFWWSPEIAGEYAYFAKHPADVKKILININQDMVGGHQTKLNTQQFISRTPYSLPSYLSDVVQDFTEYTIATNQEVATHLFEPPRRPIIAPTGSRDSYRAVVSKYFDSTDHLVFNDGFIGIPGIDFTHWPDYYIHSQFDDIFKIDPTQLKRNAFIAVATALLVADADQNTALKLAAQVGARTKIRMGDELRIGQRLINKPGPSGKIGRAFQDAKNLTYQARQREERALDSIKVFAEENQTVIGFIEESKRRLNETANQTLDEIENYYRSFAAMHKIELSDPSLSEEELKATRIVPKKAASVSEYIARRGNGRSGSRLNAMMTYEATNFIDGHRSIFDIYQAVRAEAISGDYGEVTLEMINRHINNLIEAGIVKK